MLISFTILLLDELLKIFKDVEWNVFVDYQKIYFLSFF
jgi:hypothetical protein